MGLIAHPVVGKAKSRMICEAFIAGAPKSAKGHVFYGVNETNAAVWERILDSGSDWYYIDNSYFDAMRGHQFRVTKNRVQVNPFGLKSDGVRFASLGLNLKPWQTNSHGHVVVVEQSPSFMSTVAKDPNWFHRTLLDLDRERTVVRGWHNDKLKQQATLVGDLRGAKFLVTHSSAAAVTATIEGIPPEVDPMSAMDCGALLYSDMRLRILEVLADNQFTINEMKNGEAWQWLNK